MFKKIKDKTQEFLSLHVAGATVRHKGQFSDLKVIENTEPLSNELIAKYVAPFYLAPKDTTEFRENYLEISDSIDVEVVSKLLGDFNWRPRSVGAYFAAIGSMNELEENIGRLLLRSDVCRAGHDYCLALASFSSQEAINYLNKYLEYYLKQYDLDFDQSSAMGALSYIGISRDKDLVAPHMIAWETFVTNKPNLDLVSSIEIFSQQMEFLNNFKRDISR